MDELGKYLQIQPFLFMAASFQLNSISKDDH